MSRLGSGSSFEIRFGTEVGFWDEGPELGDFWTKVEDKVDFQKWGQGKISGSGSGFGIRVGVTIGLQDRVTGSDFVAKIGVGLHDKEPRLGFRSKVEVKLRYGGQGWVSV